MASDRVQWPLEGPHPHRLLLRRRRRRRRRGKEENALAEMNDSGFHSDPTSILAKTKTSFKGLKMWRGVQTVAAAGWESLGRDKPASLESELF